VRAPVLALLIALPTVVLAQEARPLHNTSFVPSDDEQIRPLIEDARNAARRGDHAGAADLLQRVLLTPSKAVVALRGSEIYTSTRRWAQLALLADRAPFDRKVLDAWRSAHDTRASGALLGAMAGGDEREMLRILDRFPAATAAPATLLALCDRALQRADADAAHGYLLRLPEHLPRGETKAFLASEAYRRRAAFLAQRPTPAPAGWPTVGGDATRARNGDALPPLDKLSRLWASEPFYTPSLALIDIDQPKRTSASVPFYPVLDEQRIYIHLGLTVAIVSRRKGTVLGFAPIAGQQPRASLIETMMRANPGLRGATVDHGVLYFSRLRYDVGEDEFHQFNELTAYDVERKQTVWRRSARHARRSDPPVLRRPIFYRGAPAIVGERLYVYGAIREKGDSGATRREEAHLFCFDRRDGSLFWHRFLGYGETNITSALPPISGHAPAAARGVVVAVTGVGVAAGLDARSGEILWLLRYDRKPMPDRPRLREVNEKWAPRDPGWKREPPRIVGDYALFAPIDGEGIDRVWLRGRTRPDDGSFTLVCWSQRRDRDLGRNCLLEYIAGFRDGRGYYVGVRDPDRARWGYENIVSNDLEREFPFRYGRLPASERIPGGQVNVPPALFGRPALAGSMLLLPTRRALYAFETAVPKPADKEGARKELRPLGRFVAPGLDHADHEAPPPVFGSLVAIDGLLYAVTRDRVICYGRGGSADRARK